MQSEQPDQVGDLAPDAPSAVVGVAGGLHGVHGVVVVTRHVYRPALRVRAYSEVPVAAGSGALAAEVRRAVAGALRLARSVEVAVDVTASGAGLVQDVRQVAHLPGHVATLGLVVGGGQAEPGGTGRWTGATASRAALIYAVQQLMAAGQVQAVEGYADRLSLFSRRHASASAADETAWNEDTADVPGVAFCAAVSRWSHWRAWDCARLPPGAREELAAGHPACRNPARRQDSCCCRACPDCARRWQIPPSGLRVDPGWCRYCLENGLAPPSGSAQVYTATHRRIPRRPMQAEPDAGEGRPTLLPDGLDAHVQRARREAFGPGAGHRSIPRPATE